MLQKVEFIAVHYAMLLLVVVACWGGGRALLQRVVDGADAGTALAHGLAITLGLGVLICALQGLAIGGWLRGPAILCVLGAGLLAALLQWRRAPRLSWPGLRLWWTACPAQHRIGLALLGLLLLPTLFAPLTPPIAFDELMYHLPHAQQWAGSGRLTVNTWLRYPWFPYNYNLLYAAALVLGDDLLAHLLHALAGWLVALMLYHVARRHSDGLLAVGATALWLWLTRGSYGDALIDMGVTLFVFGAGVALTCWWRQLERAGWLALAAFLLGVAVGAKYQVLTLLPLFGLALVWRTRRAGTCLMALACLLLPCLYWYARNYWMTGDPFDPIGGKLFGFTDWNLADYQFQFADLNKHYGWPEWLLWPALLAPCIRAVRAQPFWRATMVFCAYATLVWALTSHYPRYLLPAYPALALCAAAGWQWLWRRARRLVAGPAAADGAGAGRWLLPALCGAGLLALAPTMLKETRGSLQSIANTADERAVLTAKYLPGYRVLVFLQRHPMSKVYQFGLENGMYYAPAQTWGDHFGPGRYADFAGLAPAVLAARLTQQGFDGLLVNQARWSKISQQPAPQSRADFGRYFSKVTEDDGVALYRITAP